jgi:Lon protease-like protein
MTTPEQKTIPLFPLGTILFPDGIIPLKIFEARYLDMIKRCFREGTPFGVISIIKGKSDTSESNDQESVHKSFSDIGTLALIEEFDPVQPTVYMTRSLGTQRFKLLSARQESDGLWVGDVVMLDNDPSTPIPPEHQNVADLLHEMIEVIQSQNLIEEPLFKAPDDPNDCGWVANRLAELLPLSLSVKNHLLGQTNPRIRLDLITEIIEDDDLRKLVIH